MRISIQHGWIEQRKIARWKTENHICVFHLVYLPLNSSNQNALFSSESFLCVLRVSSELLVGQR